MHFGFTAFNVGNMATAEFGRLAQLIEELGYESLWTAEHIVLPDLPPGPEVVRPGNLPFLDSIAVLGFLSGLTQRIKLATGVLLLPQHNPLLLAKQLANRRAHRARLLLDASNADANAYPRPVQTPYPPFVVGGRSEGAFRRTARYASGWYGFNVNLEQTKSFVADIAQAVRRYGRPSELGPVEITIAPSETLTPELIDAYAAAGVSRLLQRLPVGGTLADAERVIRESAARFSRTPH